MKCRVLKRWKWKTAFLMKGQEIDLPDNHGRMLQRLGVIEPVVAQAETAMVAEQSEQAVVKRGRGRPKGSKNKVKS